jgi:hypothetical protein
MIIVLKLGCFSSRKGVKEWRNSHISKELSKKKLVLESNIRGHIKVGNSPQKKLMFFVKSMPLINS